MSDLLQGSVVIDTTRQYRRVGQGKMATGIDKVDLAYICHYQHQAKALLRLKNRWYILTTADSKVVFSQILKDQPLLKLQLLQFCLRAISNLLNQQAVLINTSHSGLEQPDYAQKVKKRFKKAAFFYMILFLWNTLNTVKTVSSSSISNGSTPFYSPAI